MNQQNDNTPDDSGIASLMTWGELTMIKLEEMFRCDALPYAERKDLPVPVEFWVWREEKKHRSLILNKAGLVLNRMQFGWTADLSAVTPDTLDESREGVVERKRTEAEFRDRARLYLRHCERSKYAPGGQFGG